MMNFHDVTDNSSHLYKQQAKRRHFKMDKNIIRELRSLKLVA